MARGHPRQPVPPPLRGIVLRTDDGCCQSGEPSDHGLALRRWSITELAAQANAQGLIGPQRPVSVSTVRRWLAADAIKPWQHRSWIFPRDPDFAPLAFQDRYNATAEPFDWRYTRNDLNKLLTQITA